MTSKNVIAPAFQCKAIDVEMQYYCRKASKNRIKSFFMRPIRAIKQIFQKKRPERTFLLQSFSEPRQMTLWEQKNHTIYGDRDRRERGLNLPLKAILTMLDVPKSLTDEKNRGGYVLVVSTAKRRFTVEFMHSAEVHLEFQNWNEILVIEVYNQDKLFACTMAASELLCNADCFRLNFNESSKKKSIGFLQVNCIKNSPDKKDIVEPTSDFHEDLIACIVNDKSKPVPQEEAQIYTQEDFTNPFLKIALEQHICENESRSAGEGTSGFCCRVASQIISEVAKFQYVSEPSEKSSNEESDVQDVKDEILIGTQNELLLAEEARFNESEQTAAEENETNSVTFINQRTESKVNEHRVNESFEGDQNSHSDSQQIFKEDTSFSPNAYDDDDSKTIWVKMDEPFLRRRIYEQIDVTNRFPSELHENVAEWREVLLLFSELPYFEESYEILRYDCLLVLKGMYELPYARCDDLFYKMDFYRIQKYRDPDDPVYWDPDDPFFWQWRCDPKVYTVTPSVPAIERLERRMKLLDEQNSRDISFEVMCRSFAAKYCTPTAFDCRRCPEASLWDLFKDVTEQIPAQEVLDLVEPF